MRWSESKFDRYITNIATPAASTDAMASDCPFIAHRSRISFRSSAHSAASLVTIEGPVGDLGEVPLHPGDVAVREPYDPIRQARDRRIVGDDDGRGTKLPVDAFERLEHDDTGPDVECARGLVAEQHIRPLHDGAGDRHTLLLPPDSCAGK